VAFFYSDSEFGRTLLSLPADVRSAATEPRSGRGLCRWAKDLTEQIKDLKAKDPDYVNFPGISCTSPFSGD